MPRKLMCAVVNCKRSRTKKIEVFPFPECTQTSKLWKEALGIREEDMKIANNQRGVCEQHFDKAFLVKEKFNQHTRLMPGAVPNLSIGIINVPAHNTYQCRMCARVEKKILRNTVTELRKDNHILPILDICLDLRSAAHSNLPNGICDVCIAMIRFFTKFLKSCWVAQDTLMVKYGSAGGEKVQPWRRIWRYPEEIGCAENETSDMKTEFVENQPSESINSPEYGIVNHTTEVGESMQFHTMDFVPEEGINSDVPSEIVKEEYEESSGLNVEELSKTWAEAADMTADNSENLSPESVDLAGSIAEYTSTKHCKDIDVEPIQFHAVDVEKNIHEGSIDLQVPKEIKESSRDAKIDTTPSSASRIGIEHAPQQIENSSSDTIEPTDGPIMLHTANAENTDVPTDVVKTELSEKSTPNNLKEPLQKRFKHRQRVLRKEEHECMICMRIFDTLGALQRHMKRELNERGLRLRCLQCREWFDTAQELRKHCSRMHET
ncbi:uncharacterized protein LOC129767284 [Toxorhynchites rutilus septentrionalis]|uniref:uncharacterized protein LOC129767284 n=1 Tax=Toxorhynchites rutilus septentrionalis TaxID=329112 RepID=UPI00247AED54|nr:uncharacterized protein LOC129767284 [Toxorhynchites rutilus septentrionalis]